ncbi:MAG: YncE family protein [Planctomycetes bacterium]|nr:YncE family protein [Planctomycetota bacterium]MBI3845157.1 YncE family protein [Planctomycetota bacterium]
MKAFVRAIAVMISLGMANVTIVQADGTAAASGYHLLHKYKLGGDGAWDYLVADATAHRVFISRSSHVMVVDSETGAVVGDIPDTPGVHGIALAPDLGRGFTSNGRGGNVTIFDLKTLKAIGQAKVGDNPDAILFDPASKRVFAFNGRSKDATAIDAATGEVAGTIPLGGKPEFGVADGNGRVYVNIEDKSEVVEIDSKKLAVSNRWSLAPGEEPSGLAMDVKNRRLFSGCGNEKIAVMNADNGKLITTLPIGRGVDACGFDPGTGFAFASNGGDGTLTVVHEDSPDAFTVAENVATQRGARTMTLDPTTHQVFVVTADFESPPAATKDNPRPRAAMVPGSFTLLVYGK